MYFVLQFYSPGSTSSLGLIYRYMEKSCQYPIWQVQWNGKELYVIVAGLFYQLEIIKI